MDPEYFEIPYVSMISEWCLDYFDQFKSAPSKRIEDIFYDRVSKGLDEDLKEQIEDFLTNLSDNYETGSPEDLEFLVTRTETRMQHQALKFLAEDVDEELRKGNPVRAAEILREFTLPKQIEVTAIDPHKNHKVIRDAFLYANKPLFTYPGDLGQFWNDQFVEDSFISILGPEKIGKSWWLMDLAHRARRCHNDVAFFQVGDMSERQMTLRMATHLAQRNYRQKYCGDQFIPILDCENNQNGKCNLSDYFDEDEKVAGMNWQDSVLGTLKKYEHHDICLECQKERSEDPNMRFVPTAWYEKTLVRKLYYPEAIEIMDRFARRTKKTMKLSTHSNTSINIADIRNILKQWEDSEGFMPKVIVIDYADILAPEPGGAGQYRHQINETWKAMRALSQDYHCCLITATQADANANSQRSLTVANFSEDKRKHAHLTAEFSLNQTPEEKIRGVMRLGTLLARETEINPKKEITVLQNLAMGRPIILSSW